MIRVRLPLHISTPWSGSPAASHTPPDLPRRALVATKRFAPQRPLRQQVLFPAKGSVAMRLAARSAGRGRAACGPRGRRAAQGRGHGAQRPPRPKGASGNPGGAIDGDTGRRESGVRA